MQPLNAMTNVQKARLLHALLLQEIPHFLNFTKDTCSYIAHHQDALAKSWQDQLFSPDLWIELSRDAHLRIEKYGRKLEQSSVVFAEQLFDGYGAIFMVHQLIRYAEHGKPQDPKFKEAVHLLFT